MKNRFRIFSLIVVCLLFISQLTVVADEPPIIISTFPPMLQRKSDDFIRAEDDVAPFEYMPVIHKVETEKKQIAITVDDCFQAENLATLTKLAHDCGGKLTIFPIGQNAVKPAIAETLRKAVYDYGFEIENHTWSHSRIFRMEKEDMMSEVWKQRDAINQILGVNYHQRFFRLMGGDGENDQRTDAFLRQMGFEAIANWSFSGSDADLEAIQARLKPGAVFLFHTTNSDTEKLKSFIPYAVKQGYELVTLSELMGLPAVEMTDISTFPAEMPEYNEFPIQYHAQEKGDYSYLVVRIQRRLYELGYISDSAKTATAGDVADGVYGAGTAKAVEAFQRDHGLPQTGIADVDTQEELFLDT